MAKTDTNNDTWEDRMKKAGRKLINIVDLTLLNDSITKGV